MLYKFLKIFSLLRPRFYTLVLLHTILGESQIGSEPPSTITRAWSGQTSRSPQRDLAHIQCNEPEPNFPTGETHTCWNSSPLVCYGQSLNFFGEAVLSGTIGNWTDALVHTSWQQFRVR